LVVKGFLAISGDVQYVADDLDIGGSTDSYIFGLRLAVEFWRAVLGAPPRQRNER
jgi:hypothetical protein